VSVNLKEINFFASKRMQMWIFISWFNFAIRYRKTILGPAWLLVGPILFIAIIGRLFAQVGGIPEEIFIPHLTIGLVGWALAEGFVMKSTTVFSRAKAQILQGGMSLTDIVMVDVLSTIIYFAHQIVLILAVFLIFRLSVTPYALVSLVGLAFAVANGIWLTIFFGILGARYRDITEVIQAIMRIAFLATPIIWIPGDTGHGGLMGVFLVFNPFYHFLEIIRAPLMGEPIALLSWVVVISITVIGSLFAALFSHRFSKVVPLWV